MVDPTTPTKPDINVVDDGFYYRFEAPEGWEFPNPDLSNDWVTEYEHAYDERVDKYMLDDKMTDLAANLWREMRERVEP